MLTTFRRQNNLVKNWQLVGGPLPPIVQPAQWLIWHWLRLQIGVSGRTFVVPVCTGVVGTRGDLLYAAADDSETEMVFMRLAYIDTLFPHTFDIVLCICVQVPGVCSC